MVQPFTERMTPTGGPTSAKATDHRRHRHGRDFSGRRGVRKGGVPKGRGVLGGGVSWRIMPLSEVLVKGLQAMYK